MLKVEILIIEHFEKLKSLEFQKSKDNIINIQYKKKFEKKPFRKKKFFKKAK